MLTTVGVEYYYYINICDFYFWTVLVNNDLSSSTLTVNWKCTEMILKTLRNMVYRPYVSSLLFIWSSNSIAYILNLLKQI